MNTKFTAQTDKKNKFTVDSAILYSEWLCGVAAANNEAPVMVKTVLVGNGAPIEIKGKSSKGKAPGNIKGNVINNSFRGFLPIPEKVDPDADLWFEVKLPKNGLKDVSNRIPAQGAIYIRKMEWDRKVARRDDVVKLTIEFESGVEDETDATVSILEYDRDGNHDPVTSFMTSVKNNKIEIEWKYEYHEDTDEIPTEAEMQKYGRTYNPPEYFFMAFINGVVIGRAQESGLLEFKDNINIKLVDDLGNVIPDEDYEITLADNSVIKGKVDANGEASIADVCPGPYHISFPNIQIVING